MLWIYQARRAKASSRVPQDGHSCSWAKSGFEARRAGNEKAQGIALGKGRLDSLEAPKGRDGKLVVITPLQGSSI